ncbi:MAG: hypothetical protein LBU25_00180 [Treponema sp.]|jgi:oligopeptide/dipeptide ABC transporter ATP-binding protein|nr:hypothetical protein [Treponema sp.]
MLYLGEIIEEGPSGALFIESLHPYTQGLVQSIPRLDCDRKVELNSIPGSLLP